MEWGTVVGIVMPTGLASLAASIGMREWKSSPFVEARVQRTRYEQPEIISFQIRISNRRDTPLVVRGYTVKQTERAGERQVVPRLQARNFPAGSDPFGFVRTDIRIDPFISGMTAWPYAVVEGSMAMAALFTNRLLFTIEAPHRRLWRAHPTIEIDVPCPTR